MLRRITGRNAAWRFLCAAAFAALVLATQGCGSTGLVNVWSDPEFHGPVLKKALVISVRRDNAKRRLMEDTFTQELGKHGVDAVPSYRIWADTMPDTMEVIDEIRKNGYDGVIAVTRLRTREETTYVPGYTKTEPHTRYNPWTNRYHTYYREVTIQGYEETDTVIRHRVEVWTTGPKGQLTWTGEGEVIDPSSLDQVGKEITKKIVPALEKVGLIAK